MKQKLDKKSTWRLLFRAAIFLFSGIVVFQSCKKPENNIGGEIMHPDDGLSSAYVDTFRLYTYTMLDDSIRTDELSKLLLGTYNDPDVGVYSASIVTQLRLSTNNVDFTPPGGNLTDIVIDSMVLSLVYDGSYGDIEDQTVEVYAVLDDFEVDSSYYNNLTVSIDPTNLVEPGFETITPNLLSGITVNGTERDPELRIRLSNSLAQRFVNESGQTTMASNDDAGGFLDYFKGVYIKTINAPAQGEGSVLYFDPLHENTKMVMYYRDTLNMDTLSFSFNINSSCARFTKIDHDYTGTSVEAQLSDSTLGMQEFYLQTGGGLKSYLAFPGIEGLKDSVNKAIVKAELILPVDYYSVSTYSPPTNIFIFAIDDDGKTYSLPDFSDEYGGVYDDSNKEYRFTVTKYIQQVINGNISDNGLYIEAGSTSVSANKVVLNGFETTNRTAPKLIVYYSNY